MNYIQNTTYPTMFHAVFPDGGVSADFYNLTRAKHHSVVFPETERLKHYRMPVHCPTSTPLVR
jgi:hypothetical protein